ncbi:MAG: C-GCAxxG-C-C family protein [Bacteroidia bacterium]|nr:C-GCAxxG-C-C family protein [Bacteroidia bacterium]
MKSDINTNTIDQKNDAKKVFRKKGTCSRTFFFLLNREFGTYKDNEEAAIDPLAGGILKKGHQCGMLWGAALGVGAEAYKRNDDPREGMSLAIKASQNIVESFKSETQTINCYDITACDFSSKLSFAKYMITGKFLDCFKLAEDWAPKAMDAARTGLQADEDNNNDFRYTNCASLLARKMNATEEQTVMVAGLAGGLGLSGGGCGALATAVWLNSIAWLEENPGKLCYENDYAKETMNSFEEMMGKKILCKDICGCSFNSQNEHSEYILNEGCKELIETLAQTKPIQSKNIE